MWRQQNKRKTLGINLKIILIGNKNYILIRASAPIGLTEQTVAAACACSDKIMLSPPTHFVFSFHFFGIYTPSPLKLLMWDKKIQFCLWPKAHMSFLTLLLRTERSFETYHTCHKDKRSLT